MGADADDPLVLLAVCISASQQTVTAAQLDQILTRVGITLDVQTSSGRIRLIKRLLAGVAARDYGIERVMGPIPQPGLGRPAREGYRIAEKTRNTPVGEQTATIVG